MLVAFGAPGISQPKPDEKRLITSGAFALALLGPLPTSTAFAEATTAPTLESLAAENRRLQGQLVAQQARIDELAARLTELQQPPRSTPRAAAEPDPSSTTSVASETDLGTGSHSNFAGGSNSPLRISGQAGVAWFSTGSEGQFPQSTFRIDDTKLFLETPILRDTYLFVGIDLFVRENYSDETKFGELYIDFEDVSGRLGGPERLLNLRAGHLQIPFGEEYLVRDPVSNPLISHSLSDIWGLDTGVEIYGSSGPFGYVLAVQNGGVDTLGDHESDKSVTTRISWTARPWLSLSASAMRTGGLALGPDAAPRDQLSAVWFGNGFFRALGPAASTTSFHAELAQVDATARWSSGRASAAVGAVRFDDNDTTADNSRSLAYGYVETEQSLAGGLYAAARYSRIEAPDGYPLVGWGDYGRYFYGTTLTEELNRLGLGLGYRFGPPLVVKFEYTFEWGRLAGGADRESENFLGGELGLRF